MQGNHSLSGKKKTQHWENTDVESFDKDFKVANIKLIQQAVTNILGIKYKIDNLTNK